MFFEPCEVGHAAAVAADGAIQLWAGAGVRELEEHAGEAALLPDVQPDSVTV